MLRNGISVCVRRSLALSILLVLHIASAQAQAPVSPTLPAREQKLDPKSLELVVSAKTVAVIFTTLPFVRFENGKPTEVTYRGGRTGPERAKADVEKVLSEWGAFTLINDAAQADLVLVIEEQTLGPSFRTDGKPRLKDTLAVFPAGGPGTAPLWVGITTENALAAAAGLKTPNAEGVVQKFRRDVEDAKKRLKK